MFPQTEARYCLCFLNSDIKSQTWETWGAQNCRGNLLCRPCHQKQQALGSEGTHPENHCLCSSLVRLSHKINVSSCSECACRSAFQPPSCARQQPCRAEVKQQGFSRKSALSQLPELDFRSPDPETWTLPTAQGRAQIPMEVQKRIF